MFWPIWPRLPGRNPGRAGTTRLWAASLPLQARAITGLSVAAGARLFGARAAIFLAETVPEGFAARLQAKAARVVRAGADYDASMKAAEAAAAENGWTLLSDSSWPGYTDLPRKLMEGYLQLADEAARQVPAVPDLIVLQAGVGGLAAAVAIHARAVWGAGPRIVVVEPDRAPALLESARAGRAVTVSGAASAMGRLDCKTPSIVALAGACARRRSLRLGDRGRGGRRRRGPCRGRA
jgi:diaminopropionate ammonia-lyase